MALKVCTLASGSRGNCTLIQSDRARILIDIGINLKTLTERLREIELTPADITAVLVTHCHSDHVAGLKTFSNKNTAPIYINASVAARIKFAAEIRTLCVLDCGDFFIEDVTVSPFAVSHDVPCFGYSVYHGGRKVTVATDLGCMPTQVLSDISDSDVVVIESNHDVAMLRANPNYTQALKARILSPRGHLSNVDCADSVVKLARCGVRQIVLAHLSEQNNDPVVALRAVTSALEQNGISVGHDVAVDIAYQYKVGKVCVVD